MKMPSISRFFAGVSLILSTMFMLTRPAAGVEVVNKEDFSLDVGLRLQPRLEVDRVPAGGEFVRDFVVRRTRLKVKGKMHEATYQLEWKIDRTDGIGANPSASVENAFIEYELGAGVELRAGLYDQPFSRDRLTSDSKQLAVDRGAVSNVPDALGLADNVVGFNFQGKVHDNRLRFAAGLFDNRLIPGGLQDWPMAVGRLDLNLGSTKDVFHDAHFGTDRWYSLGVNGSYQGEIEDMTGADGGSNGALGIDGMIDVPAGAGRVLARSEFNVISTVPPTGGNSIDTRVWMVGLGFLTLNQKLQPIVRFDQILPDDANGGGSRNITYVGANFYQKGHSVKLQADVRFEAGTGESIDGSRLQAQVDF